MRRMDLPSVAVVLALGLLAGACRTQAPAAEPVGSAQATPETPAAVDPAAAEPAAPDTVTEADPERARRLFESGSEALAARPPDFAGAVDKLSESVRLKGDSAEAWCNLGLAHLGKGDERQAIEAFQKATAGNPKLAAAWIGLGDAFGMSGQDGAATTTYEQGIRNVPDDASLRIRLIDQLRRRGQRQEAIAQAREVLKINANSIEAYNTLGLTYLDAGEHELARFVYVKALNSVPGAKESAALHANLGLVYFHLDRPFDAEAELAESLRLEPELNGALVSMSYLKLRNLDFQGAKEMLERAVARDPDSVEGRLNLGVARRGLGDYAGAKAEYERVLAKEPSHPDALLNLGILYGDYLKEYDKALATYAQYIQARGGAVADADPVRQYIDEVEKTKVREQRRREQERRRKERDAAKASPADGPEGGAGTTTGDAGEGK